MIASLTTSAHATSAPSGIRGILGRPFVQLDEHLDLSGLSEIHEEICLALTQVPVDYTGGSHRSMGIVPPSLADSYGSADPRGAMGFVRLKLD